MILLTAPTAFGQVRDPQGFSYDLDMYREYHLPLSHCDATGTDPDMRICRPPSEYNQGLTPRQFVCLRQRYFSQFRGEAFPMAKIRTSCMAAVHRMETEFSLHVRTHLATLYRIFNDPKNMIAYIRSASQLKDVRPCPGLHGGGSPLTNSEHFQNFTCLWRQVILNGAPLNPALKVSPAAETELALLVPASDLKSSVSGRLLRALKNAYTHRGPASETPVAYSSQAHGPTAAPATHGAPEPSPISKSKPPQTRSWSPEKRTSSGTAQ